MLDAIGDAFNRKDIDAGMSVFADDAVFDHATAPDVNGIRIAGDKAYCEYLRVAEPSSGGRQEFHSVDVLTFRVGLIVHKDSYYKNRST